MCCYDCKWKESCDHFEEFNYDIELCFEYYFDYDFLNEIEEIDVWMEMSYWLYS
jgi:hypothetical protein